MFLRLSWQVGFCVVSAITLCQAVQAEQFSKNDKYLTQFLLNSLGYNVGVVDGKLGTKSNRSIAKFLKDNDSDNTDPLQLLIDNYNRDFGPFKAPLSNQEIKSTTELQQNFVYAGKANKSGWAKKSFVYL